jgi:hypothetical protein
MRFVPTGEPCCKELWKDVVGLGAVDAVTKDVNIVAKIRGFILKKQAVSFTKDCKKTNLLILTKPQC